MSKTLTTSEVNVLSQLAQANYNPLVKIGDVIKVSSGHEEEPDFAGEYENVLGVVLYGDSQQIFKAAATDQLMAMLGGYPEVTAYTGDRPTISVGDELEVIEISETPSVVNDDTSDEDLEKVFRGCILKRKSDGEEFAISVGFLLTVVGSTLNGQDADPALDERIAEAEGE